MLAAEDVVRDGEEKGGVDAAGERDDRRVEAAEQLAQPLELAGDVRGQMPSAWKSSVVR